MRIRLYLFGIVGLLFLSVPVLGNDTISDTAIQVEKSAPVEQKDEITKDDSEETGGKSFINWLITGVLLLFIVGLIMIVRKNR